MSYADAAAMEPQKGRSSVKYVTTRTSTFHPVDPQNYYKIEHLLGALDQLQILDKIEGAVSTGQRGTFDVTCYTERDMDEVEQATITAVEEEDFPWRPVSRKDTNEYQMRQSLMLAGVKTELQDKVILSHLNKYMMDPEISREVIGASQVKTGKMMVKHKGFKKDIPRRLWIGPGISAWVEGYSHLPISAIKLSCTKCLQDGHMAHQCENEPKCPKCKQEGHKAINCPRCTYCKKLGHKLKECPVRIEDNRTGRNQESETNHGETQNNEGLEHRQEDRVQTDEHSNENQEEDTSKDEGNKQEANADENIQETDRAMTDENRLETEDDNAPEDLLEDQGGNKIIYDDSGAVITIETGRGWTNEDGMEESPILIATSEENTDKEALLEKEDSDAELYRIAKDHHIPSSSESWDDVKIPDPTTAQKKTGEKAKLSRKQTQRHSSSSNGSQSTTGSPDNKKARHENLPPVTQRPARMQTNTSSRISRIRNSFEKGQPLGKTPPNNGKPHNSNAKPSATQYRK